jgi:BMFP domain-containing protein YqiC
MMEPESAIVLASARGEVEVFARTIALLEEKLTEAHQTRDTSEVNSRGLSDVEADVEQQWEESERESEEWVQELTHPET